MNQYINRLFLTCPELDPKSNITKIVTACRLQDNRSLREGIVLVNLIRDFDEDIFEYVL